VVKGPRLGPYRPARRTLCPTIWLAGKSLLCHYFLYVVNVHENGVRGNVVTDSLP